MLSMVSVYEQVNKIGFWTRDKSGKGKKNKKTRPESECTAALGGWNRRAFRFNEMRGPAADIETLKVSERIMVHWTSVILYMCSREHRIVVVVIW